MQWIVGGPDLPSELLQALEDGRLVFFCGAGISYPAGLPSFQGLVESVYVRLAQPLEGIERLEFEKQNYERVFGLIEKRIGASFVRRAVIEALRIDSTVDLPTHRSLLKLATSHEGTCRLVTTNFDRGFEFASAGKVMIDVAPKLSVPKLGVWNGIIHLHGIIRDQDPDGRSLVLTSADFGAAYLTERWASRFVSELFRRFTVLFVGYSVEDPVVRYMMDAFAADRALGEGVGPAYVLAGTTESQRTENMAVWQAKGVIPVLYDDRDRHKSLHLTLVTWADCHQKGLLGKESIVRGYASTKRPLRPFDDDPEISQVLWALSERSGHTAQIFADLEPVPPLEWLDVFTEHKLTSDLALSGHQESIVGSLVDAGRYTDSPSPLHPTARALGYWLARHLENPALLDWVFRSGSSIHPDFQAAVQRRLDKGEPLSPGLAPIWRALIFEPTLIAKQNRSYYPLLRQLSGGIWNLHVKYELLAALTPEFVFQPSFRGRFYRELPVDTSKVAQFAETELVLRWRDHGDVILTALRGASNSQSIFADLPDDLTGLLKRAMEMFEMVQKADALSDPSYSDQPSITPHKQNSSFRDWTDLIELLTEAWEQLFAISRERARQVVERWASIRYPIFRRLCFYAMTVTDLFSPQEGLAYLLEDGGWWLWSIHVYREHFRLLSSLWPKLSTDEILRLTSAIIAGPPRSMFRGDIPDADYRNMSDRTIWLHLAKLHSWGCQLPQSALKVFQELNDKHPGLELREGDRDEFLIWMESGTGEVPLEDESEFLSASDEIVVARLTAPNGSQGDDLRRWQLLIEQQPSRASKVLGLMGDAGSWPRNVWESALQRFSHAKLSVTEWPRFIKTLLVAPKALFEESTRQIAWLLREVSAALPSEADTQFWEVWDRVEPFAFKEEDAEPSKDPITRAINMPAGILAEALIDRIASKRPRTAEDVPARQWERLTAIAEGVTVGHKYARILLTSRLAWLYTLDPKWVTQNLLKYLNWDLSDEASGVWQGYLWQARVTPELWQAVKEDFLVAVRRKSDLGGFEEQITTLLGYICIDQPDWLSNEDMQNTLRLMDAKGLASVARVFFRRLQGAGDKGQALWVTFIGPRLEVIWPKDLIMVHPGSAFNLAMAATFTGSAFESAVDLLRPFCTGSQDYSHVVDRLNETDYPEKYPLATLRLLSIVDTTSQWPPSTLRDLLRRIQTAQSESVNDVQFRKLDDYLRKHNF